MKSLILLSKTFFVLFFALSLTGCSDSDWVCAIPFVCSDEAVDEAVESNDPDACDKLSYPDDPKTERLRKNQCFEKIGIKQQDLTICEKITDDDNRKNSCYMDITIALKNENDCSKIIDNERMTQECYTEIGIAKGDETLCEKGETHSRKKYCYTAIAIAKGDLTICNNIELEGNKLECISDFAIDANDILVCETISDAKKQLDCRLKMARATGSLKACVSLDEESESRCVEVVAAKLHDVSICDTQLIFNSDDSLQLCFKAVAVANKDKSICNLIQDQPEIKTNCLTLIAAKTGDFSICDELSRSEANDFDTCVLHTSKKADYAAYCGDAYRLAIDADKKQTCVNNVAIGNKNASNCTDVYNRDSGIIGLRNCFEAVTKKYNKAKTCEYIENQEWKDLCMTYIK